MRQLRPFAINILAGRSQTRPRPKRFTKDKELLKYPFYAYYKIEVNMPLNRHKSRYLPELVDRLVEDWGVEGLRALQCSSGDFHRELISGEAWIGHIFAEIYSLILDYVTTQFDETWRVPFAERNRMLADESTRDKGVYIVHLFFGTELPTEFGGLESITQGYLNAVLEGKPFEIFNILKGYVENRTKKI